MERSGDIELRGEKCGGTSNARKVVREAHGKTGRHTGSGSRCVSNYQSLTPRRGHEVLSEGTVVPHAGTPGFH